MATSLQTLSGPSLDAVRAEARERWGKRARAISGTTETRGGIGGLLGTRVYNVVFEVDELEPTPAPEFDVAQRAGIASLLAEADEADGPNSRPAAPALPTPSTESPIFAELVDELVEVYADEGTPEGRPLADVDEQRESGEARADFLARATAPPPTVQAPAGVPVMRRTAGDLVVFVGWPDHAVEAARHLSRSAPGRPPLVRAAGLARLRSSEPLNTRRELLTQRAVAVNRSRAIHLAYGIGADDDASRVASLGADQVWLVVDASAKPDDTLAWVRPVAAAVAVTGLYVVNAHRTGTASTVNLLQLPIGYVDGETAERPLL